MTNFVFFVKIRNNDFSLNHIMIIIYKPIDIRRVRLEKFRSPFYDDVIYRDESYL